MREVRCYGGPLHGLMVSVDPGRVRFEAPRTRNRRPILFDLDKPFFPLEPIGIATYEIERMVETRGNATRKSHVAVLEGSDGIFQHENDDLHLDLDRVKWSQKRNVSFLHEFERWWSWCMYRRTGSDCYIRDEFVSQ